MSLFKYFFKEFPFQNPLNSFKTLLFILIPGPQISIYPFELVHNRNSVSPFSILIHPFLLSNAIPSLFYSLFNFTILLYHV